MFGLSRGCRTCYQKQQNKIQSASRKSKREFSRRENTKCTFSSRRHLCFRLGRSAAQNPTLPDHQHIPFRRQPANIFHFHSSATAANPSIAKYFFAASVFQTRKHEVHIFSASKTIASGLTGQYLPILFSYQPYNLQQDNSFHSGASRPIPPATILSIPAHNPQQANSLPPGLAGRRLTFLPTTFLTSTKHHLPTKYRSPPFFHSSSFFYFLYRRQHPSGLRLSVPTSHHFPNALHFFRPAAASPTRRPNAKRSFARGCSLQGCRWCGRGARVSFFSFFFYFFLLLSFLSSFPSPWRRGFAATPSFFFLLFFIFLFFLFVLIFAFLFAFFFLIFSLYFSYYFLFLFFLCPFFLLFLSFYFCSYLCFLFFIFIFVFLLSFYFCFSFSFFCLSFCFTFLPSLLQSLSSLSNRSPTIHFFYSAANLSHSIQPLPAAAKKKKNIGKRIHGG